MKIIHENIDKKKNQGSLDIVPETVDDIYELSKVLSVNDKVMGFTHRKLSIDGRNQQKIGLCLTIKVESYTADLENGIMYIKGKVCQENEYVKQGVYHTLEIETEKKFKIYKDNWQESDIKTLKACTRSSQNILFFIFYEKDVVICLVGKNRIKIINKLEIKNKKFTNLTSIVLNNILKVELVAICSSNNLSREFYKFCLENKELLKLQNKDKNCKLKEKIIEIKLPNELKNSTNKQILNYIFTDNEVSKRFKCMRYVEDIKEMSKYFNEFDKGNYDYLVGKNEIQESLEYGALEKIFFTDEVYRPFCLEKRNEIEEFCRELEKYRVQIFVIPKDHLLGERLKEIGGVCGMLKFIYK